MHNNNLSRAEVYAALAGYHEEILSLDPPEATPKLRFLFERLQVAFHPNSIPPLPSAPSILYYYPPNLEFFHARGIRKEDMINSDDDRVSRVIAHNRARIDCLRLKFSQMMKEILEEEDRERQSVILGDMEKLGIEWGVLEGQMEAVELWFQDKWGRVGIE